MFLKIDAKTELPPITDTVANVEYCQDEYPDEVLPESETVASISELLQPRISSQDSLLSLASLETQESRLSSTSSVDDAFDNPSLRNGM